MILIHKNKDRGRVNIGWLQSNHSFSFWEYYNPNMMWFWSIRVINDDIIWEGMWFWTHPHNDMEIITIPLSGSLKHKDSMWNESIITTGEVQAMSAWTGILHSEFNPSNTNNTELFQIWINTRKNHIEPQYNQKLFSEIERYNKIQLLVSPNREDNVVFINQDAYISRSNISKWTNVIYDIYNKNNWIYILVISWEWEISWEKLEGRDAIWITWVDNVSLNATSDLDIIILEVPML
jgi:redox-sensitive bicupin YhaK (pirin superfamily)